jgi:hypothetical protein
VRDAELTEVKSRDVAFDGCHVISLVFQALSAGMVVWAVASSVVSAVSAGGGGSG